MDKFKDLVNGVKFHVRKQEKYDVNDIYAIEEQLKNKIISELGRKIEDGIEQLKTTVAEQKAQLEAKDGEFTKFGESKSELEKQIETLNSQLEEKDNRIVSFEKAEETRTATELLGGLVAPKAEVAVMKQLGNAFKELKFEEGATLEERQEIIKPLVDGLIETAPYFAPTTTVVKTDNKNLITKKTSSEEENDFTLNEGSETMAVDGMVF